MSRNLFRLVVLSATLALMAPATAAADWNEVAPGPSPINNSSTRNGEDPRIANVGGVPHVVWNEDTSQPNQGSSSGIRVARLAADGQSWEKIGNAGSSPISRLSSTSSESPDITDVGGVPWVTWTEGVTQFNSEIRAARYDAANDEWIPVVDTLRPINHLRADPGGNAQQPTIDAGTTDRPFISFFEADPGTGSVFFPNSETARVYVMRINAAGTEWEEVGGGPVSDIATDAAFPRMKVIGSTPYVVYFQVVFTDSGPEVQIHTARLSDDGTSWVHLPTVAAGPPGAYDRPEIASVGGVPHVVLVHSPEEGEGQIEAFRLNEAGDAWEMVGGAPVSPAGWRGENPSLEDFGGEPWVVWNARGGPGAPQGETAVVSRFHDGEWSVVGSPISGESNAQPAVRTAPHIASINGIPWVAYGEGDGQSQGGPGTPPCCVQERVSRLEPTFTSVIAQAESTRATLVAEADTFGLPFPIGFQYGPRPTFTEQTTPEPGSDDESVTVIQTVEGLEPSTLYSFRPFATAGVPLLQVIGPDELFLTESAVEPPPAVEPDKLLTYFTDVPNRWNRGHALYLRFFVSEDADITLRIRRGGQVRRTLTKTVKAGRRGIMWDGRINGRSANPGLFRLVITATGADGQVANDRNWVRIVQPRRR